MNKNFSSRETLKLTLLDKSYGSIKTLTGYESSSDLFRYNLTLFTNNEDITKKPLCNQDISFSIEANINGNDQIERVFNGIIEKVRFTKRHNAKGSPTPDIEYNLTVVPKLSILTKIKHSRVFYKPNQTVIDVIEKVLTEHKIDYELNIKNPKLFIAEQCIQYNESDYSFLCRLMQEAGLGYFFKHEKTKHILIITNQTTSYFDSNDKLLTYVDDQGQKGRLYEIHSEYHLHTTDFTVQVFACDKPNDLVDRDYTDPMHKQQKNLDLKSEKSIYTDKIQDLNQIKEFAQNFALIEQSSSQEITGRSTYASLAVGSRIQFHGKFFDSLNLEKGYVISDLIFEACENEEQYVNRFTAIPQTQHFMLGETISKPVITGLHFAMVVDKEGKKDSQEPYCEENGSVYIKLLWGEKNNLCLANVLSSTNGFAIPRIGSLVYVSFPNNNLYNDIPVIVGTSNEGLINFKEKEEWYNNIYKAYPATSDKELYNFIVLKDKKEDQEIKVHAQKDMVVEVLHDETTKVKNIRKVTIEEGNDLLDINKGDVIIKIAEGKYNFYCKGQVNIQSDAEINIESKADFTMKAGGKFTIESKEGLYMSTSGECKVESAKDSTYTSSGNINIKSSKNLVNKAGMAATYESGTATQLKANTQVNIEGTMAEVKGKANLKISAPLTKIGM